MTDNGRQIEYIPLSETSYGEPDGLFGINCGHQQYPFIPGVSLQRYYPYDEDQNAERYREFQQQRAMERKIRSDKQECMMLQAAGDEEGLKEAAKKLRLDKEKYHDFNKAHGLGDHMENTQVYGYDKSKSMKTVWAEKALTKAEGDAIISNNINTAYNSSNVSLTTHVIDQAINRGVSVDDIIDAIDHGLVDKPIKIDEYGRSSFQRIGEKATVSINPDTNTVTSTWPTGEKTLRKINKKEGKQI